LVALFSLALASALRDENGKDALFLALLFLAFALLASYFLALAFQALASCFSFQGTAFLASGKDVLPQGLLFLVLPSWQVM